MASIGMNLAPVTYWDDEEPFLDRFKTAGAWTLSTHVAATVDAEGNPTSLPADASYIGVTFSVDTVGATPNDEYVLTYDGTATLKLLGVDIVSSTPGKIVFDVTQADKSSVFMMLTAMDSSDPISNVHVVRADQVDLYNSGEIFNPAFVEKVAQWGMVRFMDWGNTNASAAVSWDSRATAADASWASGAHADGVPLEVMVQLANEAHVDMWYNVPTQADDTYVRNAMAYIAANLDPSLKVHVEYSNEVWNSGFAASRYATAQANALWGVDANNNGTIDSTEAVAHGSLIYYGYRSAQVAAIAQDVFGASADDRLVTVLAGHTTNVAGSNYALQGIALANEGSASSLFDDYAVTTYFGAELSSTAASDVATVLGWARSGAAGLDAAFQELENGGSLSTNFSLAAMGQYFAANETFAENNGLNLVAYEGGASFTTQRFSSDIRAELTTFFGEIMNDPRMGDLYTQMVDSFAMAGGSALVAFDDVGANSQYGYWGVLDDIYDTSSPRYDALVAAASASKEAIATGQIVGTAGDDHLIGTSGNDILSGGDGNDYLDGRAGQDLMAGGNGNDIYIVDDAGDVVIETADGGTDEVRTTLAAYTLGENVENLTATGTGTFVGTGNAADNVITAGAGGSQLYGADGNDTLIGGAGADYLDGGTGADTMTGGAGNDIYIVDNVGDVVTEAANGGTDEVRTTLAAYTLGANVENLTAIGTGMFVGTGNSLDNILTAGSGGSQLYGGAGKDTLIGGAGADYLDGGAGADTMAGGDGNDIYIVDTANDVVTEAANAGIDEVRTALSSYTLGANVENLTATGSSAFTGNGNELDNVLTGGAGNNTLYGGAGNDRLIGGAGKNYLDGGTGADVMIGGASNDVYIVDNAGDVVIEAANGGTDEVRTSLAAYALTANVENLTATGTGTFSGTGNDLDNIIVSGAGDSRLYGGAGNDTLLGGAGNDYIDGGTGADQMTGGAGNDIYIVDNVGDHITEAVGGGTDEVRTTLSTYTLTPNVENLTALGTDPFVGTGNSLDNVMTAGAGAATLYGGTGNDTLIGSAGADYLDGGGGTDTMIGGAGNDIYIVDNVGDVVTEAANGGIDEVRTTLAAYTLGANVENLTATGSLKFTGTGNELDNVITAGTAAATLYGGAGNDTLIGGAGADYLDGGTGTDRMSGGAGNDIYVVDNIGDVVIEAAGGGTDEVRTTLAAYTLGANLENLTAIGTDPFTGTGNELDNVLTAGSGGSHLYGGLGNDTLVGGAGADYLDGGAGADKMAGGAGNDVYIVDNSGDSVTELAGGGIDQVLTNLASYKLGANVENLTYTGTADFTGSGNALDNVIVGGNGNDTLYGNGGNDTLIGGAGNDSLYDGVGQDIMKGGTGDDTYWVTDARDTVIENANEGNDLIYASVSYRMPANVEQLIVMGGGIEVWANDQGSKITGASGNDIIHGGLGADTLLGGGGDDILYSGGGQDLMTGGVGADTFTFGPGDLVTDLTLTTRITDFNHADGDRIDLSAIDANSATKSDDAFTFIGTAAFTKHAGELRAVKDGSNYDIFGDTNGDGIADFALVVTSKSGLLAASDFLL